jgi:hypothetical protein
MRKVVLLFLILFSFGPPFIYGLVGAGVFASLGWSAGIAMFAVGTGWRLPEKGILASVLIGMCYAAAAHLPIFFIGRWIGNATSRSTEFTLALFILALLIFGALALVRRMWPRQPANKEAPRSDAAGATSSVGDVFKKFHRLMDNEKLQNERLPEPLRSEVRNGAECDQLAGATGEFGHDPRNSIPVNGPLGAMIYLSNLRTANSQPIMFHRLGSITNVDIYETVSVDGAKWDILFLHQYHPRKSRRLPSGYQIAVGADSNRLLLGINEYLAGFPEHLADAIAKTSERLFGTRVRPPQVREALGRAIFERPTDHFARLQIIMGILQRETAS